MVLIQIQTEIPFFNLRQGQRQTTLKASIVYTEIACLGKDERFSSLLPQYDKGNLISGNANFQIFLTMCLER